MGLLETEESDKSVGRREEVGFHFWLEREWHGMPDRERKRERISPQESSCTPLGHGTSQHLRLNKENEKQNRGEATQGGMEELYQRQCGSWWELFCIESSCWSAANGDQRVKEWCGPMLEPNRWGELSSWSLSGFYQGEPEESQQGEHCNNHAKRGNESSGSFNRKILSEWTDPPDL